MTYYIIILSLTNYTISDNALHIVHEAVYKIKEVMWCFVGTQRTSQSHLR